MAQRMSVPTDEGDGWIELSREVNNAVEDKIYNDGMRPRPALLETLSEAFNEGDEADEADEADEGDD